MAFTYDLATQVGQVRFLTADTDIDGYDFEDAEVQYALTTTGSVRRASAMLYRVLAGNRSRMAVRVQRGPVTEDLTQLAKDLRAQADVWEAEADNYEDDGGCLQAIISPSYERFSHQANMLQGRHGNGPIETEGYVDEVVTP
jgi:ribosomal protein S28E/S33